MTTPNFKTLKELRMWHWRQVLYYRQMERRAEQRAALPNADMSGWLKSAHDLKQKADLHLSAVQVLNDSLPGTAEQDCAQQDAKNALQPGLYEVQSTGVRVEDGKVHIDLDYTTAKPVPPR